MMTAPDRDTLARHVLTGTHAGGDAPRAVGQKFSADGQVLPFPGNTLICHIPQGAAFDALVVAQNRLRALPDGEAFAWLPPSSFHMTVFEGVVTAERTPADWPQGVPPGMPLAEVTELFLSRLHGVALPRFAIRPMAIFGGFSVSVLGATDADTASLWHARRTLQDVTDIVRPDFAAYQFHITLGYPLRWLDNAAAQRTVRAATEIAADLAVAMGVLQLGPVEFCTFADMHRFDPLLELG
jgi:hypothetical protein